MHLVLNLNYSIHSKLLPSKDILDPKFQEQFPQPHIVSILI